MDIHEFAKGLRPFDQNTADSERNHRFKNATSGYNASNYLDQAYNTNLAGRSFESYYWHLLPKYFSDSESKFDLHCLLNFAVQQLSVKALHKPEKNHYAYIGDSVYNLAASVLLAPSFLPVTWIKNPNTAESSQNQIQDFLRDGLKDDLKEVRIDSVNFNSPFDSIAKQTCGLIIIEEHYWNEDLSILIEKAGSVLAPRGTLLFVIQNPKFNLQIPTYQGISIQNVVLTSSTIIIARRES